ncbi:PQQ-like beta-propeller repeat protein [Rhodovulum adriaticum]|uniref:Outer membrane protein assembly factor BamB n=1 Tax=Rhodovulum adriaticum TaxID=35804 RepID=A0A4R2NN31_RHOAD|nr:PQQ-binding-like beta-propeller repeat protein [Rhodovulum adriaticum]MBK1634574.1 hypothetical protein [Rhodovulum adriaticum]TCP23057.1 outer membrane protein assembly factor BamB [Rhodovulum adriaticum]
MRLSRRSLLLGLPLSLAAPAVLARGGPPGPAHLHRWQTADTRLGPPALAGTGDVIVAGAALVGSIAPGADTPRWQLPHMLPGGAVFRPRTAQRRVVVGARGGLVCLDQNDGTEIWRAPAEIEIGVPALAPGLVVHGDGHRIVARDLQTGAVLWRYDTVPDTRASYAPCVLGDRVFVGPGDGQLYALRLADGRPDWMLNLRGRAQYLRQIHAGQGLLVAGSYREQLFGIDPADGRILWEFVAGNFINSHHVVDGLACLWSPTGWIYAIDIHTGAVRWRHRTTDYYLPGGNDWAPLMAELASAEGRLYTLDLRAMLRVLDLRNGQMIAAMQVPGRVRHALLPLGGGQVALPMNDGSLLFAGLPEGG